MFPKRQLVVVHVPPTQTRSRVSKHVKDRVKRSQVVRSES